MAAGAGWWRRPTGAAASASRPSSAADSAGWAAGSADRAAAASAAAGSRAAAARSAAAARADAGEMSALDPAQRARLEGAVTAAEARSSAEFVCAVARAADTYFTVPLLIAAALALALPFVLDAAEPDWTAGPGTTTWRDLAPALVFVALALVLTRPAIATRLTPA